MKRIALLFALAAPLIPAIAQTPTTPAPKPATAKSAASSSAANSTVKKPGAASASGIKLPPGVAPVRGILKTAFALRYQDVKIGTGALAEPGKLYKVHYTGYLASDGTKFDSSYERRVPEKDKDGKPVMGPDGKPKMGEPHPEPIQFPQGRRGVIPGWDQGFGGMKVGGKRRLFIPYQLAYGELGRPPVIPAKSDLIFDLELLDVTDMPQGMPGGPGGRPMPPRPGAPGAPRPGVGGPSGPGAPAAPTTTTPLGAPTAPASGTKPADPTAPTVSPSSDKPTGPPAPPPPSSTPPTAPPDKPANPAQPN